jgi:hypothetical protein
MTKTNDRLKWVEYTDGSFEAKFRGLTLEVKEGFLGATLSIVRSGPKPVHVGIPGCPSIQAAKRIARKEALKVLKGEK